MNKLISKIDLLVAPADVYAIVLNEPPSPPPVENGVVPVHAAPVHELGDLGNALGGFPHSHV